MKKTFIILSLITAMAIHAQDWSPILVNQKMNYQHSDSAYITNTIWVDSVQIINNDSLYYLNRIVKDVPGNQEIVLRNQAQFLSKNILKQEGGMYICTDPSDYLLLTLAALGDTWDFTNSISAEVTDITEDDIFGEQDSVKTISLSDGNEIRLSKNFGIIKFPDFENGGYFELVGVQDTEYGEQVIDFWDIFDFEVGDVFQQNQTAGYMADWWDITRKTTITSKVVTDSSYIYTVNGIYYAFTLGPPESYTYTENLLFIDTVGHPANKFPGQIYQFPYSTGFSSDTVFSVAKVILDNETNLVHKHFGNQEENYVPYETNLYYEQNEGNDTLFRLEYASIVEDPCGLMGFGYGESIGDIYRTDGCFEYYDFKSLEGYIKNGDTVGIITPDSLLTTVESIKPKHSEALVFPNPASGIVNISLSGDTFEINTTFELRNIQGLIVKETLFSTKEGQVDVSELSQGIYFYTIKSENKIMQSGKLVVQ
ncbi:MAG: hypothetical protein DRJ05_10365 [Bacteroidetes bacterium]|nr:MAG: hypothetical protein DRJ05_10365 [Bacteroidota bacterium]